MTLLRRTVRNVQRSVARGAGFGTSIENAQVEAAALSTFKSAYRRWRLDDVQDKGKGYDFDAQRATATRHVEVKGVSSRFPSFPITRGEAERAKVDPRWRLFVVTEALSRPKIREWTAAQFRQEFELTTIAFMARLGLSGSRKRLNRRYQQPRPAPAQPPTKRRSQRRGLSQSK